MRHFKDLWIYYGFTLCEPNVTPLHLTSPFQRRTCPCCCYIERRSNATIKMCHFRKTSRSWNVSNTQRSPAAPGMTTVYLQTLVSKNRSPHSRETRVEVRRKGGSTHLVDGRVLTNTLLSTNHQNTCRAFCDVRCNTCYLIVHGWMGDLRSFIRGELTVTSGWVSQFSQCGSLQPQTISIHHSRLLLVIRVLLHNST